MYTNTYYNYIYIIYNYIYIILKGDHVTKHEKRCLGYRETTLTEDLIFVSFPPEFVCFLYRNN